jgi:hypothetical protein
VTAVTGAPPDTPVPEAVPVPLLSPALVPRVLFPALRACYGAALLCATGPVLGLATGQPPGQRARTVARILGARHLAQAVLTAWRPRPAVLLAGAGIDACHSASMLAVAAANPRMRRAGMADALAAAAFTAAGSLVSSGPGGGTSPRAAATAGPPPPGSPPARR